MDVRDRMRPRARHAAAGLLIGCSLALLGLPASAGAATVTDLGEGFPLSVNPSDHVLLAKLVIEEKAEENVVGPWSIWAGGKSTPLAPLNGGPETKEIVLGQPAHQLLLYRLNSAGAAGGTSTVSYFKEGKEHTVFRAAYYTPDGVGHEVPPLHETITNSKGESVIVGAIGTGIDEAGDVAGIGVVLLLLAAIHNFSAGWLIPGVVFGTVALASFSVSQQMNRRRLQ